MDVGWINIRFVNILLISCIVLVIGCSPQNQTTGFVVQDQPSEEKTSEKPVAEANKTRIDESKKEQPKKEQTISEIKPKENVKYYDLAQLENDISEVMNSSYYNFTRDPSYPDHVRSSRLKYYVIHTISKKEDFVNDPSDFCDKYCAANWKGWQYYINMSNYRALHPLLGRENFSSEDLYKEYLTDAVFVNYTFIETSYEVDNGKVLEYQLISWRMDNAFKYFEGAYDGTFLIYKIYCMPNMTVFLTPKWDVYKISLPAATMSDSYKTWNHYIVPLRKELLNKSNEILKKCGVSKEFFKNYQFPEYSKSELLTGYWKIYYPFYFNLTGSISIGVKPKSDGKYLLKQVNVSFTNHDEVEAYNAFLDEGVGLSVVVIPDNKREVSYYDSEKVIGVLHPGESVEKRLSPKEVEFSSNITVKAALFVEGNVEIRPLTKTFTKEDFG